MGFLEDLLDCLCEYDDDDYDYSESSHSRSIDGRHRYVVNYVATNGMPCGVEVLAYTNGQARSSVSCRGDVKYVTSSYEV